MSHLFVRVPNLFSGQQAEVRAMGHHVCSSPSAGMWTYEGRRPPSFGCQDRRQVAEAESAESAEIASALWMIAAQIAPTEIGHFTPWQQPKVQFVPVCRAAWPK